MEKFVEQHYVVKFCVKLNNTPKETWDMLKKSLWGCFHVLFAGKEVA